MRSGEVGLVLQMDERKDVKCACALEVVQ